MWLERTLFFLKQQQLDIHCCKSKLPLCSPFANATNPEAAPLIYSRSGRLKLGLCGKHLLFTSLPNFEKISSPINRFYNLLNPPIWLCVSDRTDQPAWTKKPENYSKSELRALKSLPFSSTVWPTSTMLDDAVWISKCRQPWTGNPQRNSTPSVWVVSCDLHCFMRRIKPDQISWSPALSNWMQPDFAIFWSHASICSNNFGVHVFFCGGVQQKLR